MNRVINSIIYVIIGGLLYYSYYEHISVRFSHMGFHWGFTPYRLLEAGLTISLVSLFLPTKFKEPSDILLHIHMVFPILGMFVYYAAGNGENEFLYYSILSFLLVVIISNRIKLKLPQMHSIQHKTIQRISLIIGTLYILSIVFFSGFKYFNIDLLRVYEFRSDSAADLPSIYGYISPIVAKVILPFSFLLALVNKNRSFALASALLCLLTFAFTAHKGPLFYPVTVAGLYYILGMRMAITGFLFMNCLLISLPYTNWFDESSIDVYMNLIIRRIYYVPGLLNFLYYDFFSSPQNTFAIWTESKVSLGLLDPRYSDAIPNIIGYDYFNNPETWANTGWLGSGFMQLGLAGMIIYAMILGCLLSLLNSLSNRMDARFVTSVMIIPIFSIMVSSDLPGAFLTNGILIGLVLFSMIDGPKVKP